MKTEKVVSLENQSKTAVAALSLVKNKKSLKPMKSMIGQRSARPRSAAMFAAKKNA